jgi:hypothetical protein
MLVDLLFITLHIFYVSSLIIYCTSPQPGKTRVTDLFQRSLKSFYIQYAQGKVNREDGQVPKPSALDDLLGVSITSMDVDPSSVSGETELNAYMHVYQVSNDTDPLIWWKQHQEEFPRFPHFQAVPGCSCQLCVS